MHIINNFVRNTLEYLKYIFLHRIYTVIIKPGIFKEKFSLFSSLNLSHLSLSLSLSLLHTHTYTHARAYTHTFAHACAHHTPQSIQSQMCVCEHAYFSRSYCGSSFRRVLLFMHRWVHQSDNSLEIRSFYPSSILFPLNSRLNTPTNLLSFSFSVFSFYFPPLSSAILDKLTKMTWVARPDLLPFALVLCVKTNTDVGMILF